MCFIITFKICIYNYIFKHGIVHKWLEEKYFTYENIMYFQLKVNLFKSILAHLFHRSQRRLKHKKTINPCNKYFKCFLSF